MHGFNKAAPRAHFQVLKMLVVLKYSLNTVLCFGCLFLGLKKSLALLILM